MIAQTPPMGWNSWDCYGAAVDEPTVRQNAAYMAEHLQVFGWEYVVVDIQWYQPTATSHAYEPFAELTMDEYGRLQPAPGRFPSSAGGKGFKPLADYVHSLGLKFGIHIMRGMPRMAAHRHLPILGCGKGCHEVANPNSICAWNPDMYGLRCDMPEARAYYDSIFRMYAEWGVDFVKCDDIAREYPHCKREIEVISDACRACGRDIVLSLSPGPAPLEQAEHLKKYANMWRITDDFWDEWRLLKGDVRAGGEMVRPCRAGALAGCGHAARRRTAAVLRPERLDELHTGGAADDDDAVVHDAFAADDGRRTDEE